MRKKTTKNTKKLILNIIFFCWITGILATIVLMIAPREFSTKNQQEKAVSTSSGEIQKIIISKDTKERIAWYTKLIERAGPVQAQDDLFHSGLPFDGQTHLLNHTIGEYLYENLGAAGLLECRDYFLASCYHGFILKAIAVEGISGIDSAITQCEKKGIDVLTQCAHAVGHGFLAWIGYANLTDALKLCDQASDRINQFPLFNCHDGVFMENIWAVHTDGMPSPNRWVHPDDFGYPCNDSRIDEKYLNACWSNQASLIYQLVQGDTKKVGKECFKLSNTVYQKNCFNNLARQIHPSSNGQVTRVLQLCGLMPTANWTGYCISSVIASNFSVGGRDFGYKICAGIETADGNKKSCYSSLFSLMKTFIPSDEEYRMSCDKISEDTWKIECLKYNAIL